MNATSELRNALERGVNSLKNQKMISIHCRPHSKIVDLLLHELATLGSDSPGEEKTVTGRSIDPLTVISRIARGESLPEPERVVTISSMAEQYARHAQRMDGDNPQFEHINYEYPNSVYARRLAWQMRMSFGVEVLWRPDLLVFFGPSNCIKTCKMTLDVLLDQIKEELKSLSSDEEREQFCQHFGQELKLPSIITDDGFAKIKEFSESKVGKPNLIPLVNVEEKIASRAVELAKEAILKIA